ncbi:hypothetical protein CRG98_018004 [Punica granatum]|uniref:Retrotransposon gag domain-containing protein n=1 Tax=Punica granatum TaxID=22663 RepID=A0A2I0JZ83_PUNGR|nr:hypothetical protein CRG98_018004 [Punica granatum]
MGTGNHNWRHHTAIPPGIDPSVQSQSAATYAPPPPTPARILLGYSSAPLVYLPPPATLSTSAGLVPPPYVPPSMYMPLTPMPPVLPSSNDAMRIATLEGTVNQMASDITKLMALLGGPNHAYPSSISPHAQGSMVDLSPWVSPTLAPESDVVPIPTPTHFPTTVPPLTHVLEVYPAIARLPVTLPTTFPPPPMTVPIIDLAILAPPPMSVPTSGLIYTAPLPTIFSIPDFDKYDGTSDPRPHLQDYRNRMMLYWEYEQFMIQTFQESLKGATLSWFTSLKAANITTKDELAKNFVSQYGYNTRIAPSYLELSVMEMQEEQSFEEYATQWRADMAKHRPPIDEVEQIQIFHGTLKGAYYSHLLGHLSSFNTMIKAGKKVNLGIKLGRINHPIKKGEGPGVFRPAIYCGLSSAIKQAPGFENPLAGLAGPNPADPARSPNANFNPANQDQSPRCEYYMGAPRHMTNSCYILRGKLQALIDKKLLSFNEVKPPNV